ncbi:DinB family protein [Ekhidna sp. To15]|uniref:DinB family protein n=1 Tax=Ekhidna sp. To15 TaxID=3395267 RepID=UPI003F51EF97
MTENIVKLLQYYKSLGERSFAALSDEELHLVPGDGSNSIPTMVKHLWGNMLSRWTNFLTEDGEKDWRDREAEFDSTIKTRAEMMEKWEEGWNVFLHAIKDLKDEDLTQTVYIRNEGHTALEAIHRQLAHYSYHIGQIVYLAKMIKGEDWVSLSIPKGGTEQYNKEKFGSDKSDKHFTDEV